MEVEPIAVVLVDVSEFNTRKDLADGQYDSTIEDLARSIQQQGLLQPITVYRKSDGRYALVAGQRRLLAHKFLGTTTIDALVRDEMTEEDATAVSLIENVHRADMNPRDKARALKKLLDQLGNIQSVCRATGVGDGTVRRYLQLLDLAPELQEGLAAGEVKNTEALAKLAKKFPDTNTQLTVWDKIAGYRQDVQLDVLKQLDSDLSNLEDLRDQAAEGALGIHMIRNCPFDCPTIPGGLKEQVALLLDAYKSRN
ncbi:MAG: ParB/RepB/Spo0J family partition protein [Actinomycetota bacterium]